MLLPFRLVVALAVLVLAASNAACSGGSSSSGAPPTQPTPIVVAPITMACATPPPLRTLTGQPLPIAYGTPQVNGGTEPIVIRCTPASGTPVPVGQTQVQCTATDARSQTSSCSFTISVVVAPTVSVERFLSLGDSFTAGTVSRVQREIPGDNYVQKLQFLLSERYPDQRTSVTNAGVPGQFVDQIEDRYPGALRQSNAQVMMLQGGANDLNADGPRAITDIVTRLERMTRDAQGRGVAVILTTLTPQRPGSIKGTSPEAVRDLNVRIRDLCRRYNTGCADLYAAFGNEQSPLIGSDGLHPTLAGYDVIAETYFEVIRRLFERTATPTT